MSTADSTAADAKLREPATGNDAAADGAIDERCLFPFQSKNQILSSSFKLIARTQSDDDKKSKDCLGALCLLCTARIPYHPARNSKAIKNHMAKCHKAEFERVVQLDKEAKVGKRDASQMSTAPPDERCLFPFNSRNPLYSHNFMLIAKSPRDAHKRSADCVGAWCKLCNTRFPYHPSSNSRTIKSHYEKNHLSSDESDLPNNSKQPFVVQNAESATKKPRVKRQMPVRFLFQVAQWICTSLQPLGAVDDKGLRDLLVCCGVHQTNIPNANMLGQLVKDLANVMKQRVREILQTDCHYYSIAFDIWPQEDLTTAMACVAYFLDETFTLREVVLRASPFSDRPSGDKIFLAIESLLLEWGLDRAKIVKLVGGGRPCLSEACNVGKIASKLCFAHSLHLLIAPFLLCPNANNEGSQERTTSASAPDLDRVLETPFGLCPDDHFLDDATALPQELAGIQTTMMKFIRMAKFIEVCSRRKDNIDSLQREKFERIVEGLAEAGNGQFGRCRWISTLRMLQRIIQFQDLVEDFQLWYCEPNTLRKEMEGFENMIPILVPADWAVVIGLCHLLLPFEGVIEILLARNVPSYTSVFPLLLSLESAYADRDLTWQHSASMSANSRSERDKYKSLLYRRYKDCEFFPQTISTLKMAHDHISKGLNDRIVADKSVLWTALLDLSTAGCGMWTDDKARVQSEADLLAAVHNCAQSRQSTLTKDESRLKSEIGLDAMNGVTASEKESEAHQETGGTHFKADDYAPEKNAVEKEVASYLSFYHAITASTAVQPQDAISWWQGKRAVYPSVAEVARQVLSVPLCYEPQLALSSVRNLMKSKKLHSSTDDIDAQLFVRSNWNQLGKDVNTLRTCFNRLQN